jgi:hypothetical protein
MKAQKWVLAKGFTGYPTDENVKLVEFELPELREGGILFQIHFFNRLIWLIFHSNRGFIASSLFVSRSIHEVFIEFSFKMNVLLNMDQINI